MLQRVVCDGSEERAYQMESDDIDSLLAAVAAVAAAMREDKMRTEVLGTTFAV